MGVAGQFIFGDIWCAVWYWRVRDRLPQSNVTWHL